MRLLVVAIAPPYNFFSASPYLISTPHPPAPGLPYMHHQKKSQQPVSIVKFHSMVFMLIFSVIGIAPLAERILLPRLNVTIGVIGATCLTH